MEFLIDRKRVKDTFAAYVRNYNAEDEKILLKIRHTYRVAGISEQIAVALGLTEYDVDLSWLIGMLHDIGRFEQLKQYGTFVDADSIDHAHFGVQLLFQDGLLEEFLELPEVRKFQEDLQVIRLSIWNHSAYRIQEELDERTKLFCKIIRDADKIDIFRVAYETPLEVLYQCTIDEFQQSFLSPSVQKAYEEGHAVLRSLKKTPIDFLVGHLALAFELEYPASRKIAWNQGYLQKLLSFQSDNPDTAMQFEKMRKQMQEYLLDQ